MANFKIKGRLLRRSKVENKGMPDQSREFIVEVIDESNYPQFVKFEITKERCHLLDNIGDGETVKVQFELRGIETESGYSTTLHALHIKKNLLFKYQSEFDENDLANCPPACYRRLKMTSYRFIFKNILHENNFMPVLLVKPRRLNSQTNPEKKCKGFGLSLFQEKEGAKSFFQEWMTKTRGRFAKRVGNHLATVEIDKEDGLGSKPNTENFTHFTFHEFAKTDLTKKIGQIEKI